MKRQSWSIAFACFLGAFVGTLVALNIAERFEYGRYFWGIGALLGGIVAYFAVDFRYFCAGVAHSYRKTIAWRPYRLWWRAFGVSFVAFLTMASTALTVMILLFAVSGSLVLLTTLVTIPGALWVGCFSLAFCLLGISYFEVGRYNRTFEAWEKSLHESIEENHSLIRKLNPIAGLIFVVLAVVGLGIGVVRGICYAAISSPKAAVVVGSVLKAARKRLLQFVAGVFFYVHSERRTLCFVDATLGAAIGYSFGSAIIGAVAGAFLGVLNYELISVRWLKLAPAKS